MEQLKDIIFWFQNSTWAHLLFRIGLLIFFILLGMIILNFFINRFHRALKQGIEDPETLKRANTLIRVFKSVIFFIIFLVGVMLILSELKIDIKPIIAAAGIGGIAIGFGAQNLIKDLIAGFFLILENQIRVGDVVNIDGTGGLVEDIRLRVIVLRDLSGSLHIIPHGKVSKVTNMTYGYSYYLFDYGVAYKEDAEKVMRVIKEVAEELRADPNFKEDILEPVEILGLDKFADSAIVIRGRLKTKPIQQWRVGRELNLRVKKRFDQLGIEIPFPHRTVYFGNLPETLLKSFLNQKEVRDEKR